MRDENQSTMAGHVKDWIDDVRLAIGAADADTDAASGRRDADSLARAQRAFPLVGAMIGLVVGWSIWHCWRSAFHRWPRRRLRSASARR